jgi:hypothetical protein
MKVALALPIFLLTSPLHAEGFCVGDRGIIGKSVEEWSKEMASRGIPVKLRKKCWATKAGCSAESDGVGIHVSISSGCVTGAMGQFHKSGQDNREVASRFLMAMVETIDPTALDESTSKNIRAIKVAEPPELDGIKASFQREGRFRAWFDVWRTSTTVAFDSTNKMTVERLQKALDMLADETKRKNDKTLDELKRRLEK